MIEISNTASLVHLGTTSIPEFLNESCPLNNRGDISNFQNPIMCLDVVSLAVRLGVINGASSFHLGPSTLNIHGSYISYKVSVS